MTPQRSGVDAVTCCMGVFGTITATKLLSVVLTAYAGGYPAPGIVACARPNLVNALALPDTVSTGTCTQLT